MRAAMALVCAGLGVLAGCGEDARDAPGSVAAYGSLGAGDRLAAAEACRDRAAASSEGVAADQLARVEPGALRGQFDLALKIAPDRGGTFYALCSERLPFVTRGVEIAFTGATGTGGGFTYQTRSYRPLTLRGTVFPPGRRGYLVARRESGRPTPFRGEVDADGRFEMPTVRLRKQADNSFIVAIHSPPNALRKVRFSAICVDCLASGQPPAPPN